jgi:hypothetical protein
MHEADVHPQRQRLAAQVGVVELVGVGDRAARAVDAGDHVPGHSDGQGQQQQALQSQRRVVARLGDRLGEHIDGLRKAVFVAVDRAAQHQGDRTQGAGPHGVDHRLHTPVGFVEQAGPEVLLGGAQQPERVIAAEADGEVEQFGGGTGCAAGGGGVGGGVDGCQGGLVGADRSQRQVASLQFG